MVSELAKAAYQAPSCYNNQPWRFVFVYEKEKLKEVKKALAKGKRKKLPTKKDTIGICFLQCCTSRNEVKEEKNTKCQKNKALAREIETLLMEKKNIPIMQ